jgi:hypothetical protein
MPAAVLGRPPRVGANQRAVSEQHVVGTGPPEHRKRRFADLLVDQLDQKIMLCTASLKVAIADS